MHQPSNNKPDTIAAIATPVGRGGVGVIRISGRDLAGLVKQLTSRVVAPRVASLATIRDEAGNALDQVLTLYFPAPASFTGEDVIELQGHGGPAVMQALLARCLALGCRLARAGEFTERAFLNDKLDLVEAEAVVDMIDAASVEAVKSAARSLAGEFSARIHGLVARLTELRMHVEACIDFPEEEIDPADRAAQRTKLQQIRDDWDILAREAKQGAVLRDGLTVALIGRPNVGKSSLLNRLAGDEVAIVTPIAGTTRDQVRATIHIEGVPIHLIDTAGLRETNDIVERIGIDRTWAAVERAGAALLICEAGEAVGVAEAQIAAKLPARLPTAWVYNKIDLFGRTQSRQNDKDGTASIHLSALSGDGVDTLRAWLLETAGWTPTGGGVFMARQRHLVALQQAKTHLDLAGVVAEQFELFAEELRLAQHALSSITGEFTPDDLLGEIFGKFCIGK
ncbi:MAG: tRNA uridine-5-carboxymethylaminomethyl(34) synthesis GTPase MnmE [Aeromicrobium sp.]|nr:tRNA uridine-5-carboxymethylaminomethyl(34) synthesis GTPase MnmE [Burkholderiales bacterium]